VSKKPKTPDVAAVWHEVKGISNGLAALRITVACNQNEANAVAAANAESFDRHDDRIKRLAMMFDELQLEIAPRGFNRPPGNSVKERLDRLEAAMKSLQAAEIDAQGIDEQIGDLEVKVENLQPLHAAVSMLEAKTGNNRIEIEAILKRLDGAFRAIGRVEERLDVIGPQVRSQSERMRCQHDGMVQELQSSRISVLSRKLDTLRSIVTVLVIVQAFTTIAGLAWVLGGGW
jgi:hypothetical protein